GSRGSAQNQLLYPAGIFVDDDESVFIADRNNHRIQKWLPNATNGTTVAGITNSSGNDSRHLNSPYCVWLDKDNNMIILDSGNSRVLKWPQGSTNGTTLVQLDNISFTPWMIFDSYYNIYTSDYYNGCIRRSIPSNNYATAPCIIKPTPSIQPRVIKLDNMGNIFVADFTQSAVLKYSLLPSNNVCRKNC
ncbi:unnamed protein product, partial [Didymodactylos carnosus]